MKSSRASISQGDALALDFMLNEMVRAYKACASERGEIHKSEWDSYVGESAFSMLFEMEIRDTYAAGLATTLMANGETTSGPEDIETYLTHHSDGIADWLNKHSSEYPLFTCYVKVVDCTLSMLIRAILCDTTISQ